MSYNDSRGEKDVCRVNAGGEIELMMMLKVQDLETYDEASVWSACSFILELPT